MWMLCVMLVVVLLSGYLIWLLSKHRGKQGKWPKSRVGRASGLFWVAGEDDD